MHEIHPGADWDQLFKLLANKKGTVLILGMSDTGKSTLVRYLINRFITEGMQISLVDSDIGQSSLGLPGTVSMKVFHSKKEDFRPETMSFLGTVNPANAISGLIQTTKKMVEICRRESDLVLIDTTGLVTGGIGKALKLGKIRAIRPGWIIAIQKKEELEHILRQSDPERIIRIRRTSEVRPRSRETRLQYRNMKLKEYFSLPGSEYGVKYNGLKWLCYGKTYSPREIDFKEDLIIGLNHDSETAALGLVREAEDGMIVIRSPLESIQRVRSLVMGDIILSPNPGGEP